MDDQLAKLSLEALWRLFPIKLVDANPAWPRWYSAMAKQLQDALGEQVVRLSHIGSTAVPGLLAKPTLDLLLEVSESTNFDRLEAALKPLGFFYDTNRNVRQIPILFKKGYTIHGYEEKVYHLHIRFPGDYAELYFRDYLRDHPDVCDTYASLKKALLEQHPKDRDRYTNEKTAFIEDMTALARQKYPHRYKL